MSTYGHTSKYIGMGWQSNKPMARRLEFPQLVTILVLLFFNTSLLEYIPITIGPLTQTILMELVAFAAIFPWLRIYVHNLDARDKYLFFVGSCMFGLALVNLSGVKGEFQQKSIFTSLYAYFFVVCFFSGRSGYGYGIWLRRLHLFPALATIYEVGSKLFVSYDRVSYADRVGGNNAALYLVILLPICWVQFQNERGFFRFVNFLIIAAIPLILVLTASRTAFVVFLVVTIALFVMEKPGKSMTVLLALLLFLLTLYFILPEQSAFTSRIASLRDPLAGLNTDRTPLWKAAILSIKENPFLGGNFRANVFRLILTAAPTSNYARHIIYGVASGNFGVHNGYLAVMVDFGIPVAFLYFGFFLSLGRDLLYTGQRVRVVANRKLLLGGFICLIAYAISSITSHGYMGQHLFIIWAILQGSIKNALLEENTSPELVYDSAP